MIENPYQSPEIPTEPEEARRAQRWVAAPALGIWVTGLVYVIFGLLLFVAVTFLVGRFVYLLLVRGVPLDAFAQDLFISALGFLGMGAVTTLLGWLAMRYSKRLYRLDSDRGAHIACILGLIMYPMCVVTLPLGIYGLIVLRRKDVQAVLRQRTAEKNAPIG